MSLNDWHQFPINLPTNLVLVILFLVDNWNPKFYQMICITNIAMIVDFLKLFLILMDHYHQIMTKMMERPIFYHLEFEHQWFHIPMLVDDNNDKQKQTYQQIDDLQEDD